MKHSNSGLGVILLIVGSVMLLNNTNIIQFNMELLWPLFMIIPGVMFHVSYFDGRHRNNPTVLVPGAILVIYGVHFLLCILTDWRFSDITWPIYPLGVGIGFYELYYFGGRKSQHRCTAISVISISILALIISVFHLGLSFQYIFPAALIATGFVIICRSMRNAH